MGWLIGKYPIIPLKKCQIPVILGYNPWHRCCNNYTKRYENIGKGECYDSENR